MSAASFGRSESYTQGWRGRTSRTPIRLGKEEIGEIIGRENPGIAGSMSYDIHASDHAFWAGFKRASSHWTLAEAKAAVRDHANTRG